MADNTVMLILACLIIVAGFYIKQFWLSIFFAFIVVAIAMVAKPAPGHAPSGAKGPLVQPIVIRRRYTGPATLYPEKMKIFEDTETPSDWREYGPEGVGNFVWRGIGKIRSLLSDEE